jgi:hypothetical protein
MSVELSSADGQPQLPFGPAGPIDRASRQPADGTPAALAAGGGRKGRGAVSGMAALAGVRYVGYG